MDQATSNFVIRVAEPGELALITAHRRAMFAEMRPGPPEQLEAMAAAFETWVAERLARGDYRAWLAITAAGQVVGGAGVWVMDWPPHMLHVEPRRANILNVYVEPAYRRRGLARALTEAALGWCRQQRIVLVILHASDAGRPIYTALGFKPTNEMSLALALEPASGAQMGR